MHEWNHAKLELIINGLEASPWADLFKSFCQQGIVLLEALCEGGFDTEGKDLKEVKSTIARSISDLKLASLENATSPVGIQLDNVIASFPR